MDSAIGFSHPPPALQRLSAMNIVAVAAPSATATPPEAAAAATAEEDGLGDDVAVDNADADDEPDAAANASATAAAAAQQKGVQLLLRRQRKLRALLLSKYDAVWSQTEALGWTPFDAESEETCNYHVCWSDTSVALERIMKMNRMQKINHFPGMLELVRKAGTARNLNKMLKAVGKDYKFFPKTFMLPADYTDLKKEFCGRNHGNKTFIVKPSRGAPSPARDARAHSMTSSQLRPCASEPVRA